MGTRVGVLGGLAGNVVDAAELEFHVEVVLNGLPKSLSFLLIVLIL